MSAASTPRASDLAAQQVEQIVSAAQAAAEEIRNEARLEQQDIRRAAQREGDEAYEKARREADAELAGIRRQALALGEGARQDAEAILRDAREESIKLREKTQRSVDGRVAAAERAAAEVLEEARALSGGLSQLGKSLEEHAARILRDVQVAHKRMQADLRLGGGASDGDPAGAAGLAEEDLGSRAARPRSAPARRAAAAAAAADGSPQRAPAGESPADPRRRNPIEKLEVPSWVAPED